MKIIKVVLIFSLLAGCSTTLLAPTLETHPAPTSTLVMKPSLPSPTLTGTLALTPEEATSQAPGDFSVVNHCPEVIRGLDTLPDLIGTLVFSSNNALNNKDNLLRLEPGGNSSVSFWNPRANTITSYELPEEFYYYIYAESPDKEKLAITEGKTIEFSADVTILNREGKEVKRIAFPEEWTFFTWRGNEELLFRQFRQQNLAFKEKLGLVSIALSDEKQTILPSDFPNIFTTQEFLDWGALTVFNPATPLVLYPIYESNEKSSRLSVLWDWEKNEEIARIAGGSWPNWPAWSPDNRQLLLVVEYDEKVFEWHDEIALMDEAGELSRYTFFTEHFENARINSPVWSPNNRYVAFLLAPSLLRSDDAKLAVLDIENLTVDLFCQDMVPFPSRFGEGWTLHYGNVQINSVRPIWSPDSKYLLIENYEGGISSAFLFDLESNTITQVSIEARPVAWLK